MLPEGWTSHYSTTNKRDYYVHNASGRRQWHLPDAQIELDRNKIKEFYDVMTNDPSERSSWRAFINFLKQAIMEEFTYDLRSDYLKEFKYSVLDVGCGNGVDLGKWNRLECSTYLGFDASETQIKFLYDRNLKGFPIKVAAFCGDFTTTEAWERVTGKKFDVISCQFSSHYAFAEKASARAFMNGIASSLSDRGRVIITTVDAEEWRKLSRGSLHWGPASVHEILPEQKAFGDRYMFQIDSGKKVPEWWLHRTSLLAEASAVGLEIAFEANLASFASWIGIATARCSDWRQIQWKNIHEGSLKTMYGDEHVRSDAWALASLYKVYVLRRPGNPVGNTCSKTFAEWSAVASGKVPTSEK